MIVVSTETLIFWRMIAVQRCVHLALKCHGTGFFSFHGEGNNKH